VLTLSPTTIDSLVNLERFLCGDLEAVLDQKLLQARHLDAWAYTVLPLGHPLKSSCKTAFLQARARHELIKQEVLELVRAWNAVGIVPMLYKGFALAEWSYDQPGTRFHGDVDVLIREDEFERALEVGRQHGWVVPAGQLLWVGKSNHELSLKREGDLTVFDVHQRLVPSILSGVRRESRLTQQVWEQTTLLVWHDVQVRLLSPEDAFLFGLVVSRSYSDGWQLKSHDLLDGLALRQNDGLRFDALLKRAQALGLQRTLQSFLRRCDPFTPHLELRRISRAEFWYFELSTSCEHLPVGLMRVVVLALGANEFCFALWWFVCWALKCRGLRHEDVRVVLDGAASLRFPVGLKLGFVLRCLWQMAHWCGLTSSLAWPVSVFVALQRRGFQPVFKLGELNGQQRAWVELEGGVLPGFDLVIPNWREHRVVFEHRPDQS
jgi:hypothetical protein